MADTKFARSKDPDAVKPYLWNWSEYLGDNDTIVDADFVTYAAAEDTDAVAVTDSAFDTITATAWLAGGLVGRKELITCRITTQAGIQDDRTLYLTIKEM